MTPLDTAARLLRDAADALTVGDQAVAAAKAERALELLRAADTPPLWMDEPLADGRRVQITFDPYTRQDETTVTVAGQVVQITGDVSRARNGGSTKIPTSVGVIVRPYAAGQGGWQPPQLHPAR